jgi:hypothetical protein
MENLKSLIEKEKERAIAIENIFFKKDMEMQKVI